jgi:predicted RNA-binding protein YlxR (DUF448 family)
MPETGPNRRCIASGVVGPKEGLIRFAVDPTGRVVPDVVGNLPGRGLWVTANRENVTKAAAKGLFSRAAKARVQADPDLADLCERLLAARALQILGLARRAGDLVLGFDGVDLALTSPKPLAVLIAAADGAADGRRKLAGKRGRAMLVENFTSAEMGLALGRENVIHAALRPGGLADRFMVEVARLSGFRLGATPLPIPGKAAPDSVLADRDA